MYDMHSFHGKWDKNIVEMVNKKRVGKCCSNYLSDKVGTMLRLKNGLLNAQLFTNQLKGVLSSVE